MRPECPTGFGPACFNRTPAGTFISSTYFLWIPFLVVCLLATVQVMPTAALPVWPPGTPLGATNALGSGRAGAL